jgi:hypothetical protein
MKKFLFPMLLLALSGCTHIPLRYNYIQQSHVAAEIQQQQILDNLAMFVANPNATPYFTMMGNGLTQVNDTCTAQVTPSWTRAGFASIGALFGANQIAQENFASTLLADPHRLSWMRCAYRVAVGAPVNPIEYAECCSIQQAWNKTNPNGCPGPVQTSCQSANSCCLGGPCSGLPGPGWYCVGRKGNVPSHCLYSGHYGDTYVWVRPEGTAQLSDFTITILGFAATTRQVKWDRHWDCCCTDPGSKPQATTSDPQANALVPISEMMPDRVQLATNQVELPSPSSDLERLKQQFDTFKRKQDLTNDTLRFGILDLREKQGGGEPACKITETTVIGDASISSGAGGKSSGGGGGGGGNGAGGGTYNALPPTINLTTPGSF